MKAEKMTSNLYMLSGGKFQNILRQETSSPESTPTRVRSLVDIYETCNMAKHEPKNYAVASKPELCAKGNGGKELTL